MVNWNKLTSIVSILTLGAITITCAVLGTDGILITALVIAIAGIGGYQYAKKGELTE